MIDLQVIDSLDFRNVLPIGWTMDAIPATVCFARTYGSLQAAPSLLVLLPDNGHFVIIV
jgi:hypothetical protein